MSTGKWWLVTCTTFGTWLPGDPRGFQTCRGQRYVPPPSRYAKPGETIYRANDYIDEYRISQEILSEDPVRFSDVDQQAVSDAIVEDIAETTVEPDILAVGDVHLHLLAKFGSLRIRPTMGRFKAAATKRFHESGVSSNRIWTRGCHMKPKGTRDEFVTAFRYVLRHEAEGCVVYVWEENIPEDCRCLVLPFPIDELPFQRRQVVGLG